MALPDFTMRGLLESGAHFGHQSHRWNPKMAPYIFGARNNIHIIDLAQTVPLLHQALKAVSDTVAKGGRVLLVGTKRQAQEQIADAAKRSAQYYINSRWLGGMLTNWKTISASIQRLRKLDEQLSAGAVGLTKKERLMLSREQEKLERALGGIKDMGGVPDLIFVIDTNKEQLAVKEANRLKIPVAAVLDTNSDPDGITYPIPGNDDAGPRHRALLRSHRPRGDRRHQPRAGRIRRRCRRVRRAGWPRSCRRRADDTRGRCPDGSLRASQRPARRAGRSREAARRRPAAGQEAERRRHLSLLADRRDDARTTSRRSTPTSSSTAASSATAGSPRPASSQAPDASPYHRSPAASRAGDPLHLNKKERADGHDHCRPGQGPARENRRGHDGLQERAQRNGRRHRAGDRLAAQEGPVQGRQEVRPRRGGRSGRDCGRWHEGRRRRGEFRDGFRRPQRGLPEAGAHHRGRRPQGRDR